MRYIVEHRVAPEGAEQTRRNADKPGKQYRHQGDLGGDWPATGDQVHLRPRLGKRDARLQPAIHKVVVRMALAELVRRRGKPARVIMKEIGWQSGVDGA